MNCVFYRRQENFTTQGDCRRNPVTVSVYQAMAEWCGEHQTESEYRYQNRGDLKDQVEKIVARYLKR